jgi:Family of unknown function (DUF6308)
MGVLKGRDAVREAAGRLRDTLAMPGLGRAMAAYYDPGADFPGTSFVGLGHNPAGLVTADDLLAVSLLDIAWRPEAVRQVLGARATKISRLLAGIRADLDLWEASDADLAAVDPLWEAFLDVPGVGTPTAAKLLARKRPRLCPATDKVAVRAVGVPGQTWETLRCLLADPQARAELAALRPPAAAGESLLRLLDVAIWIVHGTSHAAGRARLAGQARAA